MKAFKLALGSTRISSSCDSTLPEYEQFYKDFERRFEDPLVIDVKKAFHWFVDYMGEDSWTKRREKVIKYFQQLQNHTYENTTRSNNLEYGKMAFHDDWIAWYMFLAESLADNPTVDEPSQSSRIWPFLAAIGHFREDLEKAKGIKSKLYDLLVRKANQPDSTLFEFVVAICYIKNGWEVEFIPESGAGKTPDLYVVRGSKNTMLSASG